MAGTSNSGGRNKKSTRALLLQGTFRKDRHGAATKPEALDPPAGRPTRPRSLTGHALAEWTRMVRRLEAAHTLSTVDDAALYQYVCLFAETEGILSSRRENAALAKHLLKAIDQLVAAAADADPETALIPVSDAVEQIVQLKTLDAKHTTQLRQGHMALRQYLVEFGMTPAARSRVTAAGESTPAANPLDRFTKRA